MKQKTRKSVIRRFKITKNGKVLRRLSFGRHLRNTKSANQKRRYKRPALVIGKIARKIKRAVAKA